MDRKTRNVVFASLLVLGVGIGTGLVAYLGLPTSAFTGPGGPDELRYVPREASLVAFADVQHVMTSELRQKLRSTAPTTGDQLRSFQEQTGINIETDVDRVIMATVPASAGATDPGSTLVLVRGRFDAVKVQDYLKAKGANVTVHQEQPVYSPAHGQGVAFTFPEPGTVAVGSGPLVRRAIDLTRGGESVLANDALMTRLRALDRGNFWAVGRFEAFTGRADAMKGMIGQLPAVTWMSISGQVDSGVRTVMTAEARDDDAANSLRDLVRGFVALAKMQTTARPELQSLLQSLQLGGVGATVTLTVDLSPQTLDSLVDSFQQLPRVPPPVR